MSTWIFIAIVTLILFILADRVGEWLSARSGKRSLDRQRVRDDRSPNLPGD